MDEERAASGGFWPQTPPAEDVDREDEPEEDEGERPRLVRSNAFLGHAGVKRPASYFNLACDEQLDGADGSAEPEEEGRPDLGEFFASYDVPRKEQVSLCRTYASYVASTLPKKRKVGARRSSPRE